MRQLLLVSNSTQYGGTYLEHCEEAARQLFVGMKRIAFVPYALHDLDGYAAKARERFAAMELELESVHEAPHARKVLERVDGVFIGGGNTFRLLTRLYETGLVDAIRDRVFAGMPYMGTSAGSNVACITIQTTNDMPIVYPPTFDGIGLVPFNINPHFLDADPSSTHMGETRETRLREFHEMNDRPVVALREGAWLRVQGDSCVLGGTTGARLFRKGQEPIELGTGDSLDALLIAT
ncbi:MAG: dipeptidase PepE [Planctomycetes bacterium]|nr:dipeptidase PepE [Planctomycetota bacterium]